MPLLSIESIVKVEPRWLVQLEGAFIDGAGAVVAVVVSVALFVAAAALAAID